MTNPEKWQSGEIKARLNEFGELEFDEQVETDPTLIEQLGLVGDDKTLPSFESLVREKYGEEYSELQHRTSLPSRNVVPTSAPLVTRPNNTKRALGVVLVLAVLLVLIAASVIVVVLQNNPAYSEVELAQKYGYSVALMDKGDYTAAIVELESIVAQKPDYKDAQARLSLARARQIIPQTTVVATATIPTKPVATATALPVLTATTKVDPAANFYDEGLKAYFASNWVVAIEQFENVKQVAGDNYRELKPLLAQCYYQRGLEIVSGQEPIEQAIANFDKALELQSDLPEIKDNKALAVQYRDILRLISDKKWPEAIGMLNQFRQGYRDTRNLLYKAYLAYGTSFEEAGKLKEALEQYNKAVQLDVPDTSEATAKITEVTRLLAPKPTATPIPSPTATPRSCFSNFYSYNASSGSVPNVADKGSSAISGLVINRDKIPIGNAAIQITSGGYTFATTTNSSGRYLFTGLGKGIWRVTVTSAPGYSICYTSSANVAVSGQANYTAYADFVESEP